MKTILDEKALSELSLDGGATRIRPKRAILAQCDEDVVAAVREAGESFIPLTPRASGTSIPSQAVGSGTILLQESRRVEVDVGGRAMVCAPGVVKAEVNDLLGKRGLWMPIDPASYKSCSMGGMVGNNSSGSRTFKYHSTVEYVRELRVVLPEEGLRVIRPLPLEEALHAGGSTEKVASLLVENEEIIHDEMPRVTKNSTGYRLEKVIRGETFDLPKLFAGSEGTLGVMVELVVGVLPKPRSRALVVFETSLEELDYLAKVLRGRGPSAIEAVDKSVYRQTGREKAIERYCRKPAGAGDDKDFLVFCEFDGDSVDQTDAAIYDLSQDAGLSQREPMVITDISEVARAWDVRNETLTIAGEMRSGERRPTAGIEDLVVPPENLGRLLKYVSEAFQQRGLEYIMYGHAGDANLHARPMLDPSSSADMKKRDELMEECFEATWRMGGSMSGEHGDGRLRASYLPRQYRKTYELMKQVKEIYDPRSLLNPGVKILAD